MIGDLEKRKSNAKISVTALYSATIPTGALRKKLEDNQNWTLLSWDYLLGLVERLFLFELDISDVGVVPAVIDSIENDEGQVPFLELIFDESGKEQLYPEQPYMPTPAEDDSFACKLRFYLHYVNPDEPLEVLGKVLSLPAPIPLPQWLADKMPYQPPN